MRLWIAAFLISLFAFQALPVTVLGKSFVKAKIATGETPGEDGGDEDGTVPEAGKLKKEGPPVEDFYLNPDPHRMFRFVDACSQPAISPEVIVFPASGHAWLHILPPDCC